jgi:hypothetical protein
MYGEMATVHFLGGCADGLVRRMRAFPVIRMAPSPVFRPPQPSSDPMLPSPVFADTYQLKPIRWCEFEAICDTVQSSVLLSRADA